MSSLAGVTRVWYNQAMSETYFSVKEAAEELGVSRLHIYRLARRGLLDVQQANPTYRKGGPTRIPRGQVLALKPRP